MKALILFFFAEIYGNKKIDGIDLKIKPIKVELLPCDFFETELWAGAEHWALASALKRHFKTESVAAFDTFVRVNDIIYSIKDEITHQIYDNVKSAYRKDMNAEKVIYYIELINPIPY